LATIFKEGGGKERDSSRRVRAGKARAQMKSAPTIHANCQDETGQLPDLQVGCLAVPSHRPTRGSDSASLFLPHLVNNVEQSASTAVSSTVLPQVLRPAPARSGRIRQSRAAPGQRSVNETRNLERCLRLGLPVLPARPPTPAITAHAGAAASSKRRTRPRAPRYRRLYRSNC